MSLSYGQLHAVSNAADPRRRSITPEAFARIIDKTHPAILRVSIFGVRILEMKFHPHRIF